MRKNLAVEDLGDLVEQPLLAILATYRADGSALLSPVWHEWIDGGFSIYIVAGDVKSRHLAADPNVTIIVAEHIAPYRSIEVRGDAVVSKPSSIYEDITRVAIRYYGDEQGRVIASHYESVDLELVRIVPGKLRAWDYADDM